MEISPWLVYLIVQLDSINKLLAGFGFFSVLGVIGGLMCFDEFGERGNRYCKISIISSLILGPIFFILSSFIPTTKNMAVILIVPAIINNEKIQQIPNSLSDLTNEWLEELRPNKGEKNGTDSTERDN